MDGSVGIMIAAELNKLLTSISFGALLPFYLAAAGGLNVCAVVVLQSGLSIVASLEVGGLPRLGSLGRSSLFFGRGPLSDYPFE